MKLQKNKQDKQIRTDKQTLSHQSAVEKKHCSALLHTHMMYNTVRVVNDVTVAFYKVILDYEMLPLNAHLT